MGYSAVYLPDHFGDQVGPIAALMAAADATATLRVGSLVFDNDYRHPVVLAKEAATLDLLSDGRLDLGIGAGWMVSDYEQAGIPYDSAGIRIDRLAEAVTIIKTFFAGGEFSFEGKHYTITDAPCQPRPVQERLPLLVGGGGEKRTLRIAAQYADEWNVWGEPALMAAKRDVLDRHCEAVGRDPASITRSANALLFLSEDESWVAERRSRDVGRPSIIGTPAELVDVVAAYAEAGVDELIIPDFNLGRDPARKRDTMDLFMEQVVRMVAPTV